MAAPTIVFDLDGTLVDTAPDLVDTLNAVLARHDVPPVSFAAARAMIGAGVKPLLQRTLASKDIHPSAVELDALYGEYLKLYAEHIADRSRPFPGLTGALDALARQGCRLAVCTNKREFLSKKLLAELGLQHYFHSIAGRDTFSVSKPDPGHLTQVLRRLAGCRRVPSWLGTAMSTLAPPRMQASPRS